MSRDIPPFLGGDATSFVVEEVLSAYLSVMVIMSTKQHKQTQYCILTTGTVVEPADCSRFKQVGRHVRGRERERKNITASMYNSRTAV